MTRAPVAQLGLALALTATGSLACSARRAVTSAPALVTSAPALVTSAPALVTSAAAIGLPTAPLTQAWNGDDESGFLRVPQTAARVDVTLTTLPDSPPCLGPEQVTANDVRWALRSRAENGALMRVLRGSVTLHLLSERIAVAHIESGSAWVRGFSQFPEVILRQPMLLHDAFVPDGVAPRVAYPTLDGKLGVNVWFESRINLSQVLPCAEVTLVRHRIEPSQVLPPARQQVVLAQESSIELHGTTHQLAAFTVVQGNQRPLGAVATLHHRPAAKGRAWVSLEVCSGTLFGTVPTSALLGAPQNPTRIAKCADVPTVLPSTAPRLENVQACNAEVPLYLHDRNPAAGEARVDRIGSLKVGGLFQIDGPEIEGRVFVALADSPVELHRITGRLVVVEADLKRHCRRVR